MRIISEFITRGARDIKWLKSPSPPNNHSLRNKCTINSRFPMNPSLGHNSGKLEDSLDDISLSVTLVEKSTADQSDNTAYTPSKTDKYILNINKSLSKKLSACDRDPYNLDVKSNCFVMDMNSAVFELLRINLIPFLQSNTMYIIEVTHKKDLEDNITSDIIRVSKAPRSTDHLFTINVYLTTCRIMGNGPLFSIFVNNHLPYFTNFVDNFIVQIQEENKNIKDKVSQSLNSMNKQFVSEHRNSSSIPPIYP